MPEENFIMHYGTPRKSGRYPWGSGGEGERRSTSFLGEIKRLRDEGLTEKEIAAGFGMTTTELRAQRSIAKAAKRSADSTNALRLKDKGLSNVAIGEKMGINESSVRSLLDPKLKERSNIANTTAAIIQNAVDEKGIIDVGAGVEVHLGISRTKLDTAVTMLKDEGYEVYYIQEQQVGTGKFTSIKVLAPPGTPYGDVYKNRADIKLVDEYSEDGGRSFLGLEPINYVDGNRVLIRYNEDGGVLKDGVVELRRDVEDISLGNARYAQVRIGVDGTHYMKGMAMYGDDIPSGYDMVYNTNKKRGTPPDKVFKTIEDDPDNPFGSTVRQKHYIDSDGKKQLSALNAVGSVPGAGEEGSWGKWSKNISSQVLSKQTPSLAKKQLGMALNLKKEELDEILAMTNPSVKKALLQNFADGADSASVHLKAAALPRQATQVLLPFKSVRENEVYAPNFRNGEQVVLIRHPHGGIFEIPELKVNNRNPEAKGLIGNALDAVGINPKVASRLSGADFDGDTVIVIPNNKRLIKTSKALSGLKDFDPITYYPAVKGMKSISPRTKQLEMGKVSNLITDMTIKGANTDEIARAVRHSMVVIDAEKHNLNYKQSAIDNGISGLKAKYQGGATSGASTIVSRSSSTVRVNERKEGKYVVDTKTGKRKRLYVDPKTGEKLYTDTGNQYVDKRTGKKVNVTTKTKRMSETRDASTLSSGTVIEGIYAKHANSMKGLANRARLKVLRTKDIPYSPSAKKVFDSEARGLRAKLALAFRNKPLERQAQLLANSVIRAKRNAHPNMDAADLKKIKGQALEEARARIGAKKTNIVITDREWMAIQAGAISPSALKQILANTDMDSLKQRAMPRTTNTMSGARTIRAKSMASVGYTNAEIADALGVSVSTITRTLEE